MNIFINLINEFLQILHFYFTIFLSGNTKCLKYVFNKGSSKVNINFHQIRRFARYKKIGKVFRGGI